jgi:hypothetical protein
LVGYWCHVESSEISTWPGIGHRIHQRHSERFKVSNSPVAAKSNANRNCDCHRDAVSHGYRNGHGYRNCYCNSYCYGNSHIDRDADCDRNRNRNANCYCYGDAMHH